MTDQQERHARFKSRLDTLPTTPGVYIMRDAAGTIIYVGKAVNLRNRVRSYFGSLSGAAPKVARMVSHIADFEYILTDTELEALILENQLIKKHQPHYNVRLKDDKTYPYIRVTVQRGVAARHLHAPARRGRQPLFRPLRQRRAPRRPRSTC